LPFTDRTAKVTLCIFNLIRFFADSWVASDVALTRNIATLIALIDAPRREYQKDHDSDNSDYDEQSSKDENAV
jgi:hypothetical protein